MDRWMNGQTDTLRFQGIENPEENFLIYIELRVLDHTREYCDSLISETSSFSARGFCLSVIRCYTES